MSREEAVDALGWLGTWMTDISPGEKAALFQRAANENGWFTAHALEQAWRAIAYLLNPAKLEALVQRYPRPPKARNVGVIMAGNIPLVGFHDVLCVLLSGHNLWMKPSTRDAVLIRALAHELKKRYPRLTHEFIDVERLNGVDAAIATGSDASATTFAYYFRRVPHLIRKNRSSCAILRGDETLADLENLGQDVFSYFGLGCRSVSTLLVPDGYPFDPLLQAWKPFDHVAMHHKYANNLDYQKAILLVNREPFLDGGHVLLRESDQLVSPISVVHYRRYHSADHLHNIVRQQAPVLQAIVSKNGFFPDSKPFGCAQRPELSDFADGQDTLAFLAGL